MRNILQPGYSSAWAPRAAVCSKKKGKKEKKIFLTSGRAVRPGAESPAKDIRKNVKTRTAVPRRKIAIFFRNVREIRCLVTAKLVHFLSRDWVRV